ncbi:sulfite oxidase heme-binding subunit YedZ [Oryzibacter oryziterrae]|uniref:sulfite oxidase heme-binding subunit YedZ n=1 Tax=Oryzibacter oryziterrae TaxID=2766474 RepID=UPI001F2F0EDC|nr:protein-methionine-sulfoxide reductase heme-binding subunit MsrQ [Oryzibacter oryziterrae]
MLPWTDRANRFSPLKALTFLILFLPTFWIGWRLASGAIGPRPYNAAVHETGDWMVRFLLASLAVTPLRRITGWNKLIQIRRMLGVASFAYGLGHLILYTVDMNGDLVKVGSEIVLRFYLTIGFIALTGLALLAATSTDSAIRRLGKRWSVLHRLVFPITVLALLHFFLQSKIDVFQATLMAGLFLWLVGCRLAARRWALTLPVLLGLAIAACLATMGLEWLWYRLATNIPASRVFAANFSLAAGLRPAWWVGATALAGLALSKTLRESLRAMTVGRQQVSKP